MKNTSESTSTNVGRLPIAAKSYLRRLLGSRRSIVLLEFHNHFVKAAVLEQRGRGADVITFVHLEKTKQGESGCEKAAARILERPEFEMCFSAVVLIPRNMISIKTLTVPSIKDDEIVNMARLQALRVSPFPPDDLVSDYTILRIDEDAFTVRIALSSARKTPILNSIRILERTGRTILAVNSSSDIVARFVLDEEENAAVVVDVDYAVTGILIGKRGKLLYSRSIPKGTRELSNNPSPAKIDHWCLETTDEIIKTIATCVTDQEVARPDRIIITGAACAISHLDEYISRRTDLKTHPLGQDSVAGVNWCKSNSTERILAQYSFCSLAGMGMTKRSKEISLIPSEAARKRQVASVRRQLIWTFLLTLMVFALCVIYLKVRIAQQEDRLTTLRSHVVSTSELADEVDRMRKQVRLINEQSDKGIDALEVLAELHEHTLESVAIEQIDYNRRDKVVLKGQVPNLDAALRTVESLKRSALFCGVKLDYAGVSPKGPDHKTRFQITTTLNGDDR